MMVRLILVFQCNIPTKALNDKATEFSTKHPEAVPTAGIEANYESYSNGGKRHF